MERDMLIGLGTIVKDGHEVLTVRHVVRVQGDHLVSGTATAPHASTHGLELLGATVTLRTQDGIEYHCLVEEVVRDPMGGPDRLTFRP
jgi:hypothetical protein